MKILYISPENTVGTLSTWKAFHESQGNDCDFITFYKTPNNFDSGICLNLPFISSNKLYRNIRSAHYKINSESKNEYSPKAGYPPTWEPNSVLEKIYFPIRDFIWSFQIESAIKKYDLLNYDIYHFEWGLDFYRNCTFSKKIKSINKKIICTYHGQDMRTRGVLKKLDTLSDLNLTSELDLLSKHPNLDYMFLPINVPSDLTLNKTSKKIKICHSPTNRYYKGSNRIIADCKKFAENNNNVEFILIENMPHDQVIEIKKTCDILIDQVGDSGGWGYGMNSIEAMAHGLCCMTQMNAKCDDFFKNHPFININENNLIEKLDSLVANPKTIDEYKNKSIEWVKRKHDIKNVGMFLYKNYDRLLNE